jgi:hypothetical protein
MGKKQSKQARRSQYHKAFDAGTKPGKTRKKKASRKGK